MYRFIFTLFLTLNIYGLRQELENTIKFFEYIKMNTGQKSLNNFFIEKNYFNKVKHFYESNNIISEVIKEGVIDYPDFSNNIKSDLIILRTNLFYGYLKNFLNICISFTKAQKNKENYHGKLKYQIASQLFSDLKKNQLNKNSEDYKPFFEKYLELIKQNHIFALTNKLQLETLVYIIPNFKFIINGNILKNEYRCIYSFYKNILEEYIINLDPLIHYSNFMYLGNQYIKEHVKGALIKLSQILFQHVYQTNANLNYFHVYQTNANLNYFHIINYIEEFNYTDGNGKNILKNKLNAILQNAIISYMEGKDINQYEEFKGLDNADNIAQLMIHHTLNAKYKKYNFFQIVKNCIYNIEQYEYRPLKLLCEQYIQNNIRDKKNEIELKQNKNIYEKFIGFCKKHFTISLNFCSNIECCLFNKHDEQLERKPFSEVKIDYTNKFIPTKTNNPDRINEMHQIN